MSLISTFWTYWLFRQILLVFHILVNFLVYLLLLISNFMALWSEKELHMISISLNLLRIVLWPLIQTILENVPCQREENVYSTIVEWIVL